MCVPNWSASSINPHPKLPTKKAIPVSSSTSLLLLPFIPSTRTSSMAAPLAGIHLPSPASPGGAKLSPAITLHPVTQTSLPSPIWNRISKRLVAVHSAPMTPESISEKVSESIKKAEEACEGDPKSGECVAAWDEVEELSAAASHARDRAKSSSDPLENYCKDNPETKECRTYED